MKSVDRPIILSHHRRGGDLSHHRIACSRGAQDNAEDVLWCTGLSRAPTGSMQIIRPQLRPQEEQNITAHTSIVITSLAHSNTQKRSP